ncbi:MAG: hypothetical protein ACRC7O_15535, partial [Fimbriiglobus sp.]
NAGFGYFADCHALDDQLDAVWEVPTGTRVRVVGVVGHRDATQPYFDPNLLVMGKCRVILLEPTTTRTVSAADLATACKADWKAASEKYGKMQGQTVILTGEVAALLTGRQGTDVTLKQPADGVEVKIYLPAAADGLKVGQPVRAKVTSPPGFHPGMTQVRMAGFLLAEPKAPLPVAK